MTDPKSGVFLLNASLPRHTPPSPMTNASSPSSMLVPPPEMQETKTQITLNPSAPPTSSPTPDHNAPTTASPIPPAGLRFTVEHSGSTTKSQLIQDEDENESRDTFDGVRSRNFGYPNGGREKRGRRSSSFSRSSIRRRLSSSRNSFKSMEIADPEGPGIAAFLLTALSVLLIIVTMPFSLCLCIKVVTEYERAVIFRLGRLRKGGSKGPGIFTVIPCIDTYKCVDLRTVSFDVPPQEILSRDSVTVSVDAVVYFNVIDAEQALCSIDDFSHSTRLLAATTLRNVLGTKNLAEILSERETISHIMQSSLDEATDPWGVKVERVEIKDVRLPVQLQRAMAAEAEAAREARAKVIAAEGEQKASKALKEAADVIQESPAALQLRYLQTLNSIAAEHNSTIIFPMPMHLATRFFANDGDN
ncbi:band 7 protein AGAP004871-like isoform X4 [Tigriopus californicus]|uniref:band 7 protein AGAP004871-like isoform X4 n=1 Tax=Tigriopus californicus TaxID=6832 RepID=UPI0027DAACDD|nr:band 7 protein AGAP004871-like isoform X4 [Tigriopus californicus]